MRLGVTTTGAVTSVNCEFVAPRGDGTDDIRVEVLELQPTSGPSPEAAALAGGDGHLAGLQAPTATGDAAWSALSPVLDADLIYRYRFVASGPSGEARTRWFGVAAAVWQPAGGMLTVDGADPRASAVLIAGSVSWLADVEGVHRVRFALRIGATDHVVGFGERFDSVDQRGRVLDAVVYEQYKAQGRWGRTYLPMPFAHVIAESADASWGFHVRTSRRTWFDVGAGNPEELWVEAALSGGQDESLDVGTYQGAPTDVLGAFLDEVGRAEELPAWVFRLWASGNEWNTQETVLARMDAHAKLDIPVGVVVIEAWSDEQGIMIFRDASYQVREDGSAHEPADFTYPPGGAWPDPAGMVAELHRRGIRVVLWQIPLLKTRSDLPPDVADDSEVLADAAALVAGGHAVREGDGSPYHNRGGWYPRALMPDLSTQRTRNWWTAKRRYLVRGLDIDGFKTDGGEHAWGGHLRYDDGRRGDDGNNLFPVHYARAFGDLLRSCGKAPVTFSRAGFTGSQAHGIVWAGDEDSTWEGFRAAVAAGITASACGIVYWGWDLAGFSGPLPDVELYLRAAEASTFMPVMQYHSEFNHHRLPLRDRTPWNVAEVNGDPTVVDVFRRYAKLRDRLVPYLAEQAHVSIRTGRPLMRALFFDHGADRRIWEFPGQFQLGDDILVSPVTDPGVSTWSVYLPSGHWVGVWTGEVLLGGRVVEQKVPLSLVPVYCRRETWPRCSGMFR